MKTENSANIKNKKQADAIVTTVEDKISSKTLSDIITSTTIGFTICVVCWMLFELYPNWTGTGVISTAEAVRDICVSLATCFCMSILGYVCLSDKFMTKISLPLRFTTFSLFGYGIIAAWVFGSGWCPAQGFVLFTIICAVAFGISGILTFISIKTADKKLQEQLGAYKSK